MQFNPDVPIHYQSEDRLGRKKFAGLLAGTIMSLPVKKTFTIGLFGPWGSGKTSLINMTVDALNRYQDGGGTKVPKVIRFEPWNYVDANQLLVQFFKVISHELKLRDEGKEMAAVSKALDIYAKMVSSPAFSLAGGLPGYAIFAGSAGLAGLFSKWLGKFGADAKGNLALRKQKVVDALSELDTHLLVIIDDIDRLTNDQIRMIFQLVNSIANFPNIIYLLSFDREVVTRALSKVQECDGEEYLEKIIQFPIVLPEASEKDIDDALYDALAESANKSALLDRERWDEMFASCLEPYFKTMRDVGRFMNTFQVMFWNLSGEIDFADLAMISALQVWDPRLLAWIYAHKSELRGAPLPDYGTNAIASRTSRREEMAKSLSDAVGEDEFEHASRVVMELFPKAQHVLGDVLMHTTSDELRSSGRIANPYCFDLVFSYALESMQVTRDSALKMLQTWDADSLTAGLIEYAEADGLSEFTSLLSGTNREISISRYPVILEAILRSQGTSRGGERTPIGSLPIPGLRNVIERLMEGIGPDSLPAVLESTLPKLDTGAFIYFANVLEMLERDCEKQRRGEMKYELDLLVYEESCTEIEDLYMDRLAQEAAKTNLLERPDVLPCLRIWNELHREQCDGYIQNALASSDKAVAVLLTRQVGQAFGIATVGGGIRDRGWTFSGADYYGMSSTDVHSAIERYARTNDFRALAEEDQEKIATLYLITSDPDDADEVTVPLEMAREQIKTWLESSAR